MKTILVVEDIPSVLDLICLYLSDEGFAVLRANNAREALSIMETSTPDVVVTDVVMPGMSGYELCRSLRRTPQTQNLPVVLCTSKNTPIDLLWSKSIGVDVHISKPFTREQLVHAVRSVGFERPRVLP